MLKRKIKTKITKDNISEIYEMINDHLLKADEIWKRDTTLGIETIYFNHPIRTENYQKSYIMIYSGENTVICLKIGDIVKYHGGHTLYVWKHCGPNDNDYRFFKLKGKFLKK